MVVLVEEEAPDTDRETFTYVLGQSYGNGLWEPTSGVRPLVFTIEGDLPEGFHFSADDPENVRIDGSSQAQGTFDFDYVVWDVTGQGVYRQKYRYIVVRL